MTPNPTNIRDLRRNKALLARIHKVVLAVQRGRLKHKDARQELSRLGLSAAEISQKLSKEPR